MFRIPHDPKVLMRWIGWHQDPLQRRMGEMASAAVAKHREVLLSVGFSTRSTKKLHMRNCSGEQGLRNRGTR